MSTEVKKWNVYAQEAKALANKAHAESCASQSEVAMLTSKLGEAEEEMKQLLEVVEQQKHASASKMKQLAILLKDL